MNGQAAVFDHVVQWLHHYQQRLSPQLTLEIAAGAGQYAERFDESRYVGFDVPETWYQPKRKLDLYASAETLPFKDGSFDMAFCVAAFDYLPDPRVVLREINRCLSVRGIFLIFTYDISTLEMIHENTRRLPESRAVAHHHVYDAADLSEYAAGAGLRCHELTLFPEQSLLSSIKRKCRPGNLRNYKLTK